MAIFDGAVALMPGMASIAFVSHGASLRYDAFMPHNVLAIGSLPI